MIPTKRGNPDGLHEHYRVTKADGSPCDPRAVYFVLRLDGRDTGHIAACRAAARAYIENAPPWLHEVAKDLQKLLDHFERKVKGHRQAGRKQNRSRKALAKRRKAKNQKGR